ncbi:MAG: PAS domain S-box protein [Flammeovirgaceae bacterium]
MEKKQEDLLEEIRLLRGKVEALESQQGIGYQLNPSQEGNTNTLDVNAALRETNNLLQEIFDTTKDFILLFQEDGTLYYLNNACLKALGFDVHDLQEITLFDFISPNSLKETKAKLLKTIRVGEFNDFDTILVSKSGEKIHVKGHVTSTVEPGKPAMLRAILYNYTEQLKAQRSQNLYYNVAKFVEKGFKLQELYHQVYLELDNLIGIDSFVLGIKNEESKELSFPYYVNSQYSQNLGIQGKEFAQIGIRLRRPRLYYEEDLKQIAPKHRLEHVEEYPKVWVAVPLILRRVAVGVMIIQSFKDRDEYSEQDLELLNFISGQLTGAIVREQNEQKINSQAARLEAIFESGSHLMWSVNQRNELTKFNKNFVDAIWEYYQVMPQQNMLFNQIYAKRSHGFHELWQENYERAFTGHTQQFEVNFLNRNGVEQWYEVFLNPIFSTDKQSIIEVSGVANNTTQKKVTELELAESEEKFRSIFDSFQDVYFRTDMHGIINLVSPSVFELIGEGQSDVVGKSVTEYYISKNKLEYLRKVLLVEDFVKNFESTLIDKDGKAKSIISNFRLIRDKNTGAPQYIEGVARDITDLKRATEQLREAKDIAEKSLAVKKQFLSNMSHEIRTPMNGIIGMIDLLSETNLDEEQQEFVTTVKKSSGSLLTILNDILDLSKIEAGKMRLRKRPIQLHKLVDKLYALFSHQAQGKNTELSYHLSPNLPDYIMADETRLLQILSNLTSNAIKFTEDGQVKIHAELISTKEQVYRLKFSVQDTGIGISKDNLDLLFKQFSQVDNSYTKSYGGTGLGLAISQEFTKMMDGEIGVESERYKGSTFWFTIQASACTQEEIEEAELRAKQGIDFSLTSSHKLLVVDDNSVNLQVASKILEKAGCEVIIAQNGQAAIDLAAQHQFELIFMDIQMPSMNGMSATRRIRRILGKRTPPVIAMTAFSLQEEREEFLAAGMDDFISKPIKAQELIGMVKKWAESEEKQQQSSNKAQTQNGIKTDIKKSKEKAPTPKQKNLPVVNLDTAMQLKKYGGDDILTSIYGEFDTETSTLLVNCQQAIVDTNIKEILSILHTLKGNSGTLGIEQVAQQSAYMEAKLKKEDQSNLMEDFHKLEDDFQRFQANYKKILSLE